MCLGIPGQILAIHDNIAVVDFWGMRKFVRLDALDVTPSPGDYVINHAGFAVRIIPVNEVTDTIALYETVLAEAGAMCELEVMEVPSLVPAG